MIIGRAYGPESWVEDVGDRTVIKTVLRRNISRARIAEYVSLIARLRDAELVGMVSLPIKVERDVFGYPTLTLPTMVDLRSDVASQGMSVVEIADALADVAETLQLLGARGVVHGSVHAGNVMRVEAGRWMLVDVGLACCLGLSRSMWHTFARASRVAGASRPPTMGPDHWGFIGLIGELELLVSDESTANELGRLKESVRSPSANLDQTFGDLVGRWRRLSMVGGER